MSNTELPIEVREALAIMKNAGDENGSMSAEEYNRACDELRKLGVMVITTTERNKDEAPVTDEDGWTFFEVSVEPFVEQIADENGEPIEGNIEHPSGGEYSDEFGDELDGYPDAMFLKTWSVFSWVRDDHGAVECADGEDYLTYEAAIARAEELAAKYRVDIDHRY